MTNSLERGTLSAGMRVRIDSTDLLDELMAFLGETADTVVEPVSPDELEVSLLGSRNIDAMRMELYLRVRAWEAGRESAGAHVEIIDLQGDEDRLRAADSVRTMPPRGVMTPPSSDDERARPGLMQPGPDAPPFAIDLSTLLWSVAAVLATVELATQLAV